MTDFNLNLKLFDADVEQAPIRKGFGEGLLAAADLDPRVVGLCADLTESAQMHFFANKYPHRFFEMGITEQSMAAVASGMAAMGTVPFIASYAMFSPGRNWEQIRTTICYNDRPVKIAGSHAGVSVGPDGGTHQAIEDIALMRVVPRMVVIVPCDALEAKKATIAAAKTPTPVYLRLQREKTPLITTEATAFEIGKAQLFFEPKKELEKKVGIIACGAVVHDAIRAARELEGEGIGATVLNLSTIKPIDREAIIALAKKTGRIVTVEEHQVAGGMGSAVAEVLAEEYPVKIKFVGVRDVFGQSGTPAELLTHYGIDAPHILAAARSLVEHETSDV